MASKVITASLYWKGRRFAAQFSGSFTPTMQSESVYNEDGYVCMTRGAKESDIEVSHAKLLEGDGIEFSLGDEGAVQLAPINGKVVTIANMTVLETPIEWDATKGTMTGRLKLHGGEPKYRG
jgi:hypothetical protein